MVVGRGLGEPDIAGIARQLPALERADDRVAVAQFATRGVDQIGPALEALERLLVDHMLGLGVERAVERDHVAHLVKILAIVVPSQPELGFDLGRQPMAVVIMQVHVERL